MSEPARPSKDELARRLDAQQYHVTQEKGTERAFSGRFNAHKAPGTYTCVCCGAALFSSAHKYDSGSGWPSYWQPAAEASVRIARDASHGMTREEVLCAACDAHLGHVFPDGPPPTGLRYCINSASLNFLPKPDSPDVAKE